MAINANVCKIKYNRQNANDELDIERNSKLEEEKPFMGEEVAKTLIVDEIDDEGYIKLHSRRRIRNDIYEQQFYKIHADQVNKIIEMAVQYGNEAEYFAHLLGKCKDCNTSKKVND